MVNVPSFEQKDYEDTIDTFNFMKTIWKSQVMYLLKDAYVGLKAPNPAVLSLDSESETLLLDFQKKSRPLVINFGSCTWPPFIAHLARFNDIVDEFRNFADFVIVYIEEPHASDGWRFNNNYDINQPRSIKERLQAARQLKDLDPHCPILVDKMKGEADRLYGAFPEKLVIVLDGIVVYESKIGPWGYDPAEVSEWLKTYFKS